jgi:hypothetical protein
MVETLIGWMKKNILPVDGALRAGAIAGFCWFGKWQPGILR